MAPGWRAEACSVEIQGLENREGTRVRKLRPWPSAQQESLQKKQRTLNARTRTQRPPLTHAPCDLGSLRQRLPRRFPLFTAFFGFARPAVLAEDFFAALFFLDFAFARGAGLDLDFFAGFDRDAREGEGAEEPPGRSVTITSSSVSSIALSFSPSSSSICESSFSSPLSCSHAIAPPSIRPLLPWADFAVHTRDS
jgi:hypothetical protein